MQTLLLVPTQRGCGLTSAALGMIRALDHLGIKAGYMRAFYQRELSGSGLDHSSKLVESVMHLKPPAAMDQKLVERLIGDDQLDEILESVVETLSDAAQGFDVMVVEGVVPTSETSYAKELNAALANALDASVIMVDRGDVTDAEGMADRLDVHSTGFGGLSSAKTLGTLIMRARGIKEQLSDEPVYRIPGEAKIELPPELIETLKRHSGSMASEEFAIIGVIPERSSLAAHRTSDLFESLEATWINKGAAHDRRVLKTTLIARSIANMQGALSAGSLLVTPGDRSDVLVSASLAAMNGVPLAGVVLTGGLKPDERVLKLCQNALSGGLPLMLVDTDSYETVQRLANTSSEIPADDLARAEQVTNFVAAHIDLEWLKKHFDKPRTARLSPAAFRYELVKQAKAAGKTIVLPEGDEPRTIEAANLCQERGIAQCILLAKREAVEAVAANRGITLHPDLTIMDPEPERARFIDTMIERRRGKLSEPLAREQIQDNVVLGTMMLYSGEVDGLVSGAVHTTANTVRPAFQYIKTAPGYSLVSSIFFMLLPEQVLVYGDCAINPEPDSEQLAEIAIQSALSAKAFGIESPKVAMISYSTGSSGAGADVTKVAKATEIAQQKASEQGLDILIDGPLQYDAAYIESVGKQKAPDSKVAGHANVFVFPDLNTGNTTYKAVQRSAGVVSVGPMLQGLNKPVNDLSRGALVDDIVYTIALTAIQAARA